MEQWLSIEAFTYNLHSFWRTQIDEKDTSNVGPIGGLDTYTVEPLTNDHPHQRPSLSYDHISCDGQWFLFVYESLTSDHPSYTTAPMWFWGWSYKRGSTVSHLLSSGIKRLTNCALTTMQMTVAVVTFQYYPKQYNRDVALCRTIRRPYPTHLSKQQIGK